MDKYQLEQYTSTRQLALRKPEERQAPSGITLFGNAAFSMDSLHLVNQKITTGKKNQIAGYVRINRNSMNNAWTELPGTALEVAKIQTLFKRNNIGTNTFIETEASEENLKAQDGNSSQVIHLATHGFFLPPANVQTKGGEPVRTNSYITAEDPLLRSGLVLAGGNYTWSGKMPVEGVEDGIVTAYEIAQLDLNNTELVVLSACETALGDVKGSEGVFGLQRAFKIAGVKKMIVSLWQVPDKETAELMTGFYSYWMNGKSINESFIQAQVDMRKKYPPFYWAAFVLVE